MSTRTWLSTLATLAGALGTTLVLVAAPPLLSTGCAPLECAEGTIEENGACVPADSDPSSANCGEGTVLADNGTCESVFPPTTCDPLSTIADEEQIPGQTVCVGVGGVGGCSADLACPTPASNKMSVCGRLYDVETDERIIGTDAVGARCGSGDEVLEGPCQLKVGFYDAIEYANDPSGATELAREDFFLDDCGRYVVKNVNVPLFMGIAVDDASGAPDTHRNTGVAFPAAAATIRNRQKSYVITRATDEAWSVAAGAPFSATNTFVDVGVYMAIFMKESTPVLGVTVTGANNASRPGDDYYFTDTDPTTRSMVVAGGPTGANGAALLINSGLVAHSGTGGEPTDSEDRPCHWPSDLADSIAGVLFLSTRVALDPENEECN